MNLMMQSYFKKIISDIVVTHLSSSKCFQTPYRPMTVLMFSLWVVLQGTWVGREDTKSKLKLKSILSNINLIIYSFSNSLADYAPLVKDWAQLGHLHLSYLEGKKHSVVDFSASENTQSAHSMRNERVRDCSRFGKLLF